MKAACYHHYGPPEVVSIQDMPIPKPQSKEMLIKIHATTVNRTDCGFRSAYYFVSRFFSGLFRPKRPTLGCEFAGEIVEVGGQVQQFQVGQRVVGFDEERFGGHAQYMCLPEKAALALIPDSMSYLDAAPITEGAHYALSYIDAFKPKNKKVLVYGASGAIGSAAVQLLPYFGAEVVAVCATQHLELMKSLGIEQVIDYTKEELDKYGRDYDFVLDAVGKINFAISKELLKENGVYASTELGKNAENIFLAIKGAFGKGKRVIFPLPQTKKEDIELLTKLTADGVFRPITDRIYSLEDIVEAYRYVESGQKVGNVVIDVKH